MSNPSIASREYAEIGDYLVIPYPPTEGADRAVAVISFQRPWDDPLNVYEDHLADHVLAGHAQFEAGKAYLEATANIQLDADSAGPLFTGQRSLLTAPDGLYRKVGDLWIEIQREGQVSYVSGGNQLGVHDCPPVHGFSKLGVGVSEIHGLHGDISGGRSEKIAGGLTESDDSVCGGSSFSSSTEPTEEEPAAESTICPAPQPPSFTASNGYRVAPIKDSHSFVLSVVPADSPWSHSLTESEVVALREYFAAQAFDAEVDQAIAIANGGGAA